MSELLDHLVREPKGDAEGAIILCHGRGTDEYDLFPLFDQFDPDRRLLGITPGAPLTNVPPGGRHWYVIEQVGQPDVDSFLAGENTLAKFCDETLRERGIPWDRTVIGGFSQGGAMALATAYGMGRPSPAGVMVMSSFLPMVQGWRMDLAAKKDVPVWVSHGSMDPIIPAGFGRRTKDLLEADGITPTYHETRVLHSIDPSLLPAMRTWLKEAIPPAA